MPSKEGRIAIRPYTCVIRTLANIHINHVNTQKKRRHGHGMREFACVVGANCNSPTPQFAHIVFRTYYEFTYVEGRIAIRPHPNSPILQNSPMLQIRPHRKFIHIAKFIHVANSPMFSIDHNGRANCPQWMSELPTMDGRIAIRPYTCVIRTLANIICK